MSNKIEFFAEYDKWIAVKKLDATDRRPIEVARFLSSVHESIDRKMWEFMGEEMSLEELDKIAYELTGAQQKKKKWKVPRKSQDEINQIIAQLKSPSVTRKMGIKNKELKTLAKVYLNRKVLELLGIGVEPETKKIEKYIEKKDLGEA